MLQIVEGRVAGAEIVDGDAAAELLHGVDEGDALIEIGDGRRLGDLDDEAARHCAVARNELVECDEPLVVARRQPRDIEGEPQIGLMTQQGDAELEHALVDQAAQT